MSGLDKRAEKRQLRILEKIFQAEIEDRLPCPLTRHSQKDLTAMVEAHLIVAETITLPGRFPVEVSGYCLTHTGRLLYCLDCKDEHE